jgi:hypothetical protein
MDENCFQLLFLGIPFVCLTIMYIVLTLANKSTKTTGEIKFILPPDILLKVFAVFLLVSVVFILATRKIISEATVAALLGAIGSGTLGIAFSKNKQDDQKKQPGREEEATNGPRTQNEAATERQGGR